MKGKKSTLAILIKNYTVIFHLIDDVFTHINLFDEHKIFTKGELPSKNVSVSKLIKVSNVGVNKLNN